MTFGLIAGREAVPELGRLACYLEGVFDEPERVVLGESG